MCTGRRRGIGLVSGVGGSREFSFLNLVGVGGGGGGGKSGRVGGWVGGLYICAGTQQISQCYRKIISPLQTPI